MSERRPRVTKKARATAAITILMDVYERMSLTLDARDTPWHLLVAAILAAQCTDARVNMVTPALFEQFPTIDAMADSSPEQIEPYIKTCGLFRNKAKNIHLAANYLLTHEDGQVPADLDRLLKVPGVGRKIANLLLGDCFGQQAIVVDTHCARLAKLLGFTTSTDPRRVERDLERVVPEAFWTEWGHFMVEHGRAICVARRPQCTACPIAGTCAYGRRTLGLDGWVLENVLEAPRD